MNAFYLDRAGPRCIGGLAAALTQFALGNVPHKVVLVGAIGGLIADLIAIVAGAYFYKEA